MQRIGGDNIVFRRPDLHGAGDIFWLYCSWDLGKIFILGPFPVPLIGNRPSVCHRGASIQGPCGCGILVRCRVKRKSERRNLRGCHRDNRRPRDAFFCIRPNRIDCGRPVLEGPRRSGGRRVAVSGRPWDIAPNASGQLLPVDCNGSPFCVCLCKKCQGRIILDVRSALRLRGEYWRGCPINGDGRRLGIGDLILVVSERLQAAAYDWLANHGLLQAGCSPVPQIEEPYFEERDDDDRDGDGHPKPALRSDLGICNLFHCFHSPHAVNPMNQLRTVVYVPLKVPCQASSLFSLNKPNRLISSVRNTSVTSIVCNVRKPRNRFTENPLACRFTAGLCCAAVAYASTTNRAESMTR